PAGPPRAPDGPGRLLVPGSPSESRGARGVPASRAPAVGLGRAAVRCAPRRQRRGSVMATDLTLTNVHLPDGRGPLTIHLRDGRVAAIGADPPPTAAETLDARGGVALPRLVDAHLHLDKTLMGEHWTPLPDAPSLRERIATAEALVLSRVSTTIADRATALADSALRFGTLALRSHVDVTPGLGLRAVEALLA